MISEVIYEPPQIAIDPKSYPNLLKDAYKEQIDILASCLGLEKVGWIFTADHSGDMAMRSNELIQAAKYQLEHQHKHPCGYMVPKFVTFIAKSFPDGNFPAFAYQASDILGTLIRDEVLLEDKLQDDTLDIFFKNDKE